ncbi:MAG TPA: UDP-N-acetylmuramoyl-L-alanine--D-glutamate ligase [Stellaceae bacterium]|nr:UDP-N-acetylmuramoyl-L-alanine--D-glutamate ligase [Stellaceae bacterium]
MRVAELGSRRVAIWGLGREGRAAIGFLRRQHPGLPLVLLDDEADRQPPDGVDGKIEYAFGAERIARAVDDVDVIVKSPGVILYRCEIQRAREQSIEVTSLLNLWFAEQFPVTTICVTGTKGKSTTASLLADILTRLGRRVALVGNIGVPITEIGGTTAEFAIIEVSSYQAADFSGLCDIAMLTSLYPEHLDWHLTVENYFRDKINLLIHSRCRIVNRDTAEVVGRVAADTTAALIFNDEAAIHAEGTHIFQADRLIGEIPNPYLSRPHNKSNLCAALTAAKSLGIDLPSALHAVRDFRGLPHRQQELGEVDGILFVDDSIATIPEATMAALAVYQGRDIAVIVGGYDRGIEYNQLVETVVGGAAKAVICLGESGARICSLARAAANPSSGRNCAIYQARSMAEAVSLARLATSPGGVVLLSPAAPSYGYYRDYVERGDDFAAQAGLRRKPVESISHSPAV